MTATRTAPPPHHRVRATQVEVTSPFAPLPDEGCDTWRVLVEVHGWPVGELLVPASDAARPGRLERLVHRELADEIHERMSASPQHAEPASFDGTAPAATPSGPATVVVATRDRVDQLERCLASLRSLDHPAFEVIVVDNAPSDGSTRQLVEQLARDDPRIHYCHEPRPGLATAHNAGVRAASGAIVAFTDDDVVVDRRWLSRIVRAFEQDPDVCAVTGMILPQELMTPAQHRIEQFAGFNKGFRRRVFDLAAHRPDDPLFPYTIGAVGSGANMAFRRDFLQRNGGFDEALGAGTIARGGDDLAALFDVVCAGRRVVYEPAAIVFHRHHEDDAALRRQVHGYGVGYTAFLAHAVSRDPRHLFRIAARVVPALRYLLTSSSRKNAGRQADFPTELTTLERRGMLEGPLRYAQSRWRLRAHRGHGGRP